MSVQIQVKRDYDKTASLYHGYSGLPTGILESQLLKLAAGDCTGLNVLDLGGGTGLHACELAGLGAAHIDVVDISLGMLDAAEILATSLGYQNRMRFFEADISKSLQHLPLSSEDYDLVMGNWIFSFADSSEMLEGMFSNITTYLKPGGTFVGVRDANPRSPILTTGKYGGICADLEEIPGGLKYRCILNSDPPVEFECCSLQVIYSGSTEMFQKFGLTNIENIPYEACEVVQQDRKFWADFLDSPCLAMVRAMRAKV